MKKHIYKITNKINGRCYIGQTNNPKRRFQEHKNMGYTDGTGKLLYYAFNKYGIENFTFEVIDSGENYDELEKYLADIFSQNVDVAYRRVKYFCAENHERFLREYMTKYEKTPQIIKKLKGI